MNKYAKDAGIYLDNAATTPMCQAAFSALLSNSSGVFGNISGNPNSSHALGQEAAKSIEQSREIIAGCVDCEPGEIIFTSSASEACRIAMREILRKDTFTSQSEHEHRAVFDYGTFLGAYKLAVNTHILVNNETGEIYDLDTVQKRDPFFTDATAAVGQIPVSFKDIGATYMAFGGHKFGAPIGIGCLIAKGGMVHINNISTGTEPVALIASLAAALQYRQLFMETQNKRIISMRDKFEDVMRSVGGVTVNAADKNRVPGISSLTIDGVNAQALVMALSDRGVYVSAGSACNSKSVEPSRVLMADGLTAEQALSTIRVSIGWQNKEDELVDATKTIIRTVVEMRDSM